RELMRELALGRTEGGGRKLVELLNYPSLNVRGMSSARTGAGASNVIPASATATIDIRLVKGIDPATAVKRVADHIRKQGYEIVADEPDAATRMRYPKLAGVRNGEQGYAASRTSMDLPISQLVSRTAESARGPVVKLPTMGGSVPLFMIEEILHAPTITVPIANHDNNQHSYNENIRIQNLWDGIELMAALLPMYPHNVHRRSRAAPPPGAMIPINMRLGYLFLCAAPLVAQPHAFTASDYARAEKFMPYDTNPLVYRSGV